MGEMNRNSKVSQSLGETSAETEEESCALLRYVYVLCERLSLGVSGATVIGAVIGRSHGRWAVSPCRRVCFAAGKASVGEGINVGFGMDVYKRVRRLMIKGVRYQLPRLWLRVPCLPPAIASELLHDHGSTT